MKKIILILISIITISQAHSQNIDKFAGNWDGILKTKGIVLRIIFKIKKINDTTLDAKFDVPKQFAYNVPINKIFIKGDTIILKNYNFHIKLQGFIKDSTFIGFYKQGQYTANIILKNNKNYKISDFTRPQTPKPPYPYKTEEVRIEDKKNNVTLAGTITIPKDSSKKYPAVVMVTGSGPQNRDEELFMHKPFLVIADYLTRHGIAVLRYDDRGFGKSVGNYNISTTKDFAQDALNAVIFLRNHKNIDKNNIGIIGHSEGGLIAEMLAADKKNNINFIVLLSAPGVPTSELMLDQNKEISLKNKIDTAIINRNYKLNSELYQVLKTENNNVNANKKLNKVFDKYTKNLTEEEKEDQGLTKNIINSIIFQSLTPWFKYFIRINPADYLQKIKCPVLALGGSNDLQVKADKNLKAIKNNISKNGNKNVTVKELPKLNHLFQHSKTGLPQNYKDINETFSPEALKIISDWINKTTENK